MKPDTIELTADQCAMLDLDAMMTIKGGRTAYEATRFCKNNDERICLSRLQESTKQPGKLRQINRYVTGNTVLEVKLTDNLKSILIKNGLLSEESDEA